MSKRRKEITCLSKKFSIPREIVDYNKKNSEMYLRLLMQEQVDHMMSFSMDWWWNIYQNFPLDEHFSKTQYKLDSTCTEWQKLEHQLIRQEDLDTYNFRLEWWL